MGIDNAAVRLARAAADVATYCDHAEHLESADAAAVRRAGGQMVVVGYELAGDESPLELYARRLEMIEAANAQSVASTAEGGQAIRAAQTWRAVQAAQIEHDRSFHLDVSGLAKIDQLRHYAFHLAKFPLVALGPPEEPAPWGRVADMVLFGVKLQTVTNRTLPDEPVDPLQPPDWVEHRL